VIIVLAGCIGGGTAMQECYFPSSCCSCVSKNEIEKNGIEFQRLIIQLHFNEADQNIGVADCGI
jgi:hypothetical protein